VRPRAGVGFGPPGASKILSNEDAAERTRANSTAGAFSAAAVAQGALRVARENEVACLAERPRGRAGGIRHGRAGKLASARAGSPANRAVERGLASNSENAPPGAEWQPARRTPPPQRSLRTEGLRPPGAWAKQERSQWQ
jgi:hypothetical protein